MQPSVFQTETLLADGRVLVVSGPAETGTARRTPLARWTDAARGRVSSTATLLKDGRVLVVGGFDGTPTALAAAALWNLSEVPSRRAIFSGAVVVGRGPPPCPRVGRASKARRSRTSSRPTTTSRPAASPRRSRIARGAVTSEMRGRAVVEPNDSRPAIEAVERARNRQGRAVAHARECSPAPRSALVATGSYTADGGVVVAHNTWVDYAVGERWRILFDIRPESGHRFFMDGFPGMIHSASDFGVNSAGLIITETSLPTLKVYDPAGIPEFSRARKAMQYASSIDDFVRIMQDGNNGGYANTWLVADRASGEIASLGWACTTLRSSAPPMASSSARTSLRTRSSSRTRSGASIRTILGAAPTHGTPGGSS